MLRAMAMRKFKEGWREGGRTGKKQESRSLCRPQTSRCGKLRGAMEVDMSTG